MPHSACDRLGETQSPPPPVPAKGPLKMRGPLVHSKTTRTLIYTAINSSAPERSRFTCNGLHLQRVGPATRRKGGVHGRGVQAGPATRWEGNVNGPRFRALQLALQGHGAGWACDASWGGHVQGPRFSTMTCGGGAASKGRGAGFDQHGLRAARP